MTALIFRRLMLLAPVALLLGLSACGDTWRGLREDTGQNLEATGGALESAGEEAEPSESN